MKKAISLAIVFCLFLTMFLIVEPVEVQAATYFSNAQIDSVINWAMKIYNMDQQGQNYVDDAGTVHSETPGVYWYHYCMSFVYSAFKWGTYRSSGLDQQSYSNANQAYTYVRNYVKKGIPERGAMVLYCGTDGVGHVALSLGNGKVMHSYNKKIRIDDYMFPANANAIYEYTGWCAFKADMGNTMPSSDTTAPVISNVQVTNKSATGYTISCTVTDNVNVNRVLFPTWTSYNGQDDVDRNWGDMSASKSIGTKNGNTYTFRVESSAHNNERGPYITHIYAFDDAGNAVCSTYEVGLTLPYPTLIMNTPNQTLAKGKSLSINVSSSPATVSRSSISWRSSNPKVLSISSNGVVTAKAVGSATIYATYKSSTVKCFIRVSDPTLMQMLTANQTVEKGNKLYIKVKSSDTNYNRSGVTWKSSNPSVLAVSSNGVVTAKAAGSATIYATYKNTTAKCTITVKNPSVLKMYSPNQTLNKGNKYYIKIGSYPVGLSRSVITWKSSNPKAVSVDSNGVVTAKAVGSATIYATYKNSTVKCYIRVNDPALMQMLTQSQTIDKGNKLYIKIRSSYSDYSHVGVTWKSSNPSVLSVSSNGVVTAKSAGSATIYATYKNATAKCFIRVR